MIEATREIPRASAEERYRCGHVLRGKRALDLTGEGAERWRRRAVAAFPTHDRECPSHVRKALRIFVRVEMLAKPYPVRAVAEHVLREALRIQRLQDRQHGPSKPAREARDLEALLRV